MSRKKASRSILHKDYQASLCSKKKKKNNQAVSPQPEPGAKYLRPHQGWLSRLCYMQLEPGHRKSLVSALSNPGRFKHVLDPLCRPPCRWWTWAERKVDSFQKGCSVSAKLNHEAPWGLPEMKSAAIMPFVSISSWMWPGQGDEVGSLS